MSLTSVWLFGLVKRSGKKMELLFLDWSYVANKVNSKSY